jgi:hypothetical protein
MEKRGGESREQKIKNKKIEVEYYSQQTTHNKLWWKRGGVEVE